MFSKIFCLKYFSNFQFLYIRLVLLSYIVTDVKSHYLLAIGRCYCHLVISGKFSTGFMCGRCYKPLWQMELPFSYNSSYFRLMLLPYVLVVDVKPQLKHKLADVIAKWQML